MTKVIRAGAERIDDLEPLWSSLQRHHASVAPTLAGIPVRSVEESWRRRRAKYEDLLARPDAFLLIAERDGRAVGYACVVIGDPYQGWGSGERVGEVETLAVLDDDRGGGVGTLLMDAVERELAALGIAEMRLDVLVANDPARRFYERRGLRPATLTMFGHVGGDT